MILKGVGKMSESKTSVAPANSSGSKKQTAKMLGFGGFFAMTASMVMTVYAYPNFASSGLHLIFFLILGGVFWFLPVALVAAEMATVKDGRMAESSLGLATRSVSAGASRRCSISGSRLRLDS